MKEETLEERAVKIYNAIFQDQESVDIDGELYLIERTSQAKVRCVHVNEFSFIEQNPKKDSKWAKMVREGHKIMWVLKGYTYVAQVRDGKFFDLKRKSKKR